MSMQAVNKLPVEVLSRIFVMGERMHCGPRTVGLPYVGFQDLVVQICHRWRRIAINTPKLWTYIFISRPPPHLHAELYISRSGTLTLHIDLTTKNSSANFRPSHQHQLTEALQTLDFIEKAGGKRHRWGSLIVVSNSLSEIISVYLSLAKPPSPTLRFVSMKWSPQGSSGNAVDLGIQLFRPHHTTLTHGAERPQLSHVEFNGLPRYCIFDRDSPLVSNLTRFTFVCPVTMSIPSHEEFSAVLSASPRLEQLSVDMRPACFNFVGVEPGPATVASLQVHLPLLRSFSLDTNKLYQWTLYLLWIVDAPGVSDLAINTHYSTRRSVLSSALTKLYWYLAKGRVNEALQCHASLDDNTPGSGPLFPWLKHLSVERIARTTSIFPLFTAFSMVSHVTLGGVGVAALASYPEHLPNVSCVTYISDGTLSLLRAVECLKRIASSKTILTLIWCMDLRVHESTLLGLEADGIHLGYDRHYRSPPGWHVEHIIVRQIYQAPEDQYDKDEDDYLGIGGLFERR